MSREELKKQAKNFLDDEYMGTFFSREAAINFAVEFHESKVKEKTFSEYEIGQLQSKIHKITGDGEVMMLFNELLGICAG